MSTRTIPDLRQQLDASRDSRRRLIGSVRDSQTQAAIEARRLLGEIDRTNDQFDIDRADLEIIARLHQQVRDDQLADINEELEGVNDVLYQLGGVLNGRPEPAPFVEPIVVPTIAQATPLPPTPAPTQVITTPPAAVRERSAYHPRNWTFLAWFFAVIGLVLAWNIIGANWDEAIFDSWFSALIWIGGIGLGFFGGGALGDWLTPTPNQVVVTRPPQGPTPPPAQ